MSVRETPIDQWSEFLDQFSRGHRAWLATVDRVQPDSISHTEAIERPLGAVVPQISARRVAGIEIRFQRDSRADEPIRIERPTSVRVDETADGTARSLEITGERDLIRAEIDVPPTPPDPNRPLPLPIPKTPPAPPTPTDEPPPEPVDDPPAESEPKPPYTVEQRTR